MPGYSGKPVWQKLGIKPGTNVALVDPPEGAADLLEGCPEDCTIRRGARGAPDLTLLFLRTRQDLEKRLETAWRLAFPDRVVWVSWPKKSSELFVDLTEDQIREIVLPRGLVDVKVCAIDDDWSGLKLMVRKELR